ncbi:MAG: indolepyruvate oxidoreductase subunit B [Rhodobacteraceae bacterium]|nr:indolepyruvate oxidoreductase subunit B [Paracoccaceae bacterium]
MKVNLASVGEEIYSETDQILKIAILAVGGQGGGVLTSWIEVLARNHGYACQATSVAGVAQRTGATTYYIEMAKPKNDRPDPVFALAPASGDVDILIASELMEAGRAIIRGFVTPDRTTLIASTHRALAVSEKIVPGDGIANSDEVQAAAKLLSKSLFMTDLEKLAAEAGSVISASLFGALAGVNVLPFERSSFESTIKSSGKSVEASLRAFNAGYRAVNASQSTASAPEENKIKVVPTPSGPASSLKKWSGLVENIREMPDEVADMAFLGLRKVVEFQDLDYGEDYLSKVNYILSKDTQDKKFLLTKVAAKHIANAMSYDDIIRVADEKTKTHRYHRIRDEMGANDDTVMHLTEFLHPRAEELVSLLPARLGLRIENSPKWMALFDTWVNRGRRWRSDGIMAFTILYLVGGLKRWRLKTRRHAVEVEHMRLWLKCACSYLPSNYDMAVEIIKSRRLIKGYSDTHARGKSKFDLVLEGACMVAEREDGAEWVNRLCEAALKDEEGDALSGALKTIRTFV